MFPEGDVFGTIARALFRPSAVVRSHVDAFKAKVAWESHFVVSL